MMMNNAIATVRLGLAALLGITFSLGYAPPAQAGKWVLDSTRNFDFFVPDDQVGKNLNRERTSHDLVKSETIKRNEKTGEVREYGAISKSEATEEKPGPRSKQKRAQKRYLEIYDTWKTDIITVTTSTLPYSDYKVTDYELSIVKTYKNSYRVTGSITYKDPRTNRQYETPIKPYSEGPFQEPEQGPWTAKQDKEFLRKGSHVKVDRAKTGERNDEKFLSKGPLPVGAEVALARGADAGRGTVVTADGSKGSAGARNSG
jgi:hypothetical protein